MNLNGCGSLSRYTSGLPVSSQSSSGAANLGLVILVLVLVGLGAFQLCPLVL